MTRRPDADETLLLGERSGWKGGERFYLQDLALFLHQSRRTIRWWAKKQGLIKRQRLLAGPVEYFTRYGAMRVIAHFRILQGEEYLAGRDYHRAKDTKMRASQRDYRRAKQCR